jgi:hypothetical protein
LPVDIPMAKLIPTLLVVLLNIHFLVHSTEIILNGGTPLTNDNRTRTNGREVFASPSNKYIRTGLPETPALKGSPRISQPSILLQSISANLFMQAVAGTNTSGYTGDNGPATSARIKCYIPWVDTGGNIYIGDSYNHIIRKVTRAGIITTFGGTGIQGFAGTAGPIESASFDLPYSIVGDVAGTVLYICDHRYIWKYEFSTNIATVFAHSGVNGGSGFSGDGGPASSSKLFSPRGIWLTSSGDLFIADCYNHRIRKIISGIITTIAGSGCFNDCSNVFSGDHGLATLATLNRPYGVYVDTSGKIIIADTYNHRIRLIDTNNIITTFTGTGTAGYNSDNNVATSANINLPHDVKGDSVGNIYIADAGNNIVRLVDTNGIISTIFGTGFPGFSSGISPRISLINAPVGISIDSLSSIYFSDYNSIHRSVVVSSPSSQPSKQPTRQPTVQPTRQPSSQPSLQPTCQPTSFISGTLKEGLVAHYPFDRNARDQSGNGNNGEVHSAMLTSDRFGNPNSAYSFDGSSSYIQVNNGRPFDFSNSFSVAFWVKPVLDQKKWATIFSKSYVTDGSSSWAVEQNNQHTNYFHFVYLQFSTNSWMFSNDTLLLPNRWNHYVITKQNAQVKSYFNGKLLSLAFGTNSKIKTNGNSPLFMGIVDPAPFVSPANKYYFNGSLDDLFIYNRTITADEVLKLYKFDAPTSQPTSGPTSQPSDKPSIRPINYPSNQPTSQPSLQPVGKPTGRPSNQPTTQPTVRLSSSLKNGLVAYYPFDGNANDKSGNGNNGVIHGGVSLMSDRFGNPRSAMNFDGSSGYIEIPGKQFSFTSNMSLSFWINPFAVQCCYMVIFDKSLYYPHPSVCSGWAFNGNPYSCNTSNIYGLEYLSPTSSGVTQSRPCEAVTSSNVWSHWTVTKEGRAVTFYINGQLREHGLGKTKNMVTNGNLPLIIGGANWGATIPASALGLFYKGLLDDIVIFNRSLSISEINELYNFDSPTSQPSSQPVSRPTSCPTSQPTLRPTDQPSCQPTSRPSVQPTQQPSKQPTTQPSQQPSTQPTVRISSFLKNGLVAYFPFNGNANDYSGNDNHGTVHGGVSLVADRFGNTRSAYAFDGSSGYLTVNGNQFNFAGNMSLSLWFASSQSSCCAALLSKSGCTGKSWVLRSNGPNLYEFRYAHVRVGNWQSSDSLTVSLTDWNHLVVTKENNWVSLYLNTQVEHRKELNGSTITSVGSEPLVIGSTPCVGYFWRGIMDDIFVYNRTLSFTEIRTLYQYDSPTSQPTIHPTGNPTGHPSKQPTNQPTQFPSTRPTQKPSSQPSEQPTCQPNDQPTTRPTTQPSVQPTSFPSALPSQQPNSLPTAIPSRQPSGRPTSTPSMLPTSQPSALPTSTPSSPPTSQPTLQPTGLPSVLPSSCPSSQPNCVPTMQPSSIPTQPPFSCPSSQPTSLPSNFPTCSPTLNPAVTPTNFPSSKPSSIPSLKPSTQPSSLPSILPSGQPSSRPSIKPSCTPFSVPSIQPTSRPSSQPSCYPTNLPTTKPSRQPSSQPTMQPSRHPTSKPSKQPSSHPSSQPTSSPITSSPTSIPTIITESPTPLRVPSISSYPSQTRKPTRQPITPRPTAIPSVRPSFLPTSAPTQRIHVFPSGRINFKESLFFFGSYLPAVENIPNIYLTEGTIGASYIIFGFNRKKERISKEIVIGSRNSQGLYSIVMNDAGLIPDHTMSRTALPIGDFNGDSHEDLVICDPINSYCFLYFDHVNGFQNLQVSFAIKSNKNDLFGWSIAKMNDINRDNFDDFSISALSSNTIYFFFGSNSDHADINIDQLDSSVGSKIIGSQNDQNSGLALSSAGDFNSDGHADILFTAIQITPYENVIYVLFLNSKTMNQNIIMDNLTPNKDYFKITAPLFSFVGFSLSDLGDINQDGFDDIIIGSIPYSGRYLTQKSYVIYGKNSSSTLALSEITEEDGFTITGGGFMVGGPGDVNGDGIPDIMIGSYQQWQGKGNSYIMVYPRNVTNPPTFHPSSQPTSVPSSSPTSMPSLIVREPTSTPTFEETTNEPVNEGTFPPFLEATQLPSLAPKTSKPTRSPSIKSTTYFPTIKTDLPSVCPSRNPTAVPTVRPTRSSNTKRPSRPPAERPTTSHFTTFFPSLIVSESIATPFEEITIDRAGVYNGPSGKVNYIISGEGSFEIVSYGGGNKIYTILPSKNIITITNFDKRYHQISLIHFPYLYSINDLVYGTSSLQIFLSNEQKIILPLVEASELTEGNFIFKKVIEDQNMNSDRLSFASMISLGILVCCIGVVVFLVKWNQIDEDDTDAWKDTLQDTDAVIVIDTNNESVAQLEAPNEKLSSKFSSIVTSPSESGLKNDGSDSDNSSEEEGKLSGNDWTLFSSLRSFFSSDNDSVEVPEVNLEPVLDVFNVVDPKEEEEEEELSFMFTDSDDEQETDDGNIDIEGNY